MPITMMVAVKGFTSDGDAEGKICFTTPSLEFDNAVQVAKLTHRTLFLMVLTEQEYKTLNDTQTNQT